MPFTPDQLARLRAQRESISSTSEFLDKKTWTKKKLRFLMLPSGDIYHAVTEIYSVALKTFITSPATFGKACPVLEYLVQAKNKLSKEEYEAFRKQTANASETYYMACIDMADPGTPENPHIRIFKAPKGVANSVLDYMWADEDSPDNVCDVLEGRSVLIEKTGTGLNTEWSLVKWSDAGPISDDEAYIDAVRTKMKSFDMAGKYKVTDYAALGEVYKALTGDEMDMSVFEDEVPTQTAAPAKPAKVATLSKAAAPATEESAPAKPAPAKPAAPKPAPKPTPKPEPEATQSEPAYVVGAAVIVAFGEDRLAGKISGLEASGEYEITLDEPVDGNQVFVCAEADLTLVAPKPVPPKPATPKPASKTLAARRP